MHFPNEKVIYEVPIYSMSQKEFQHRWENWKKKCYIRSEEMGHTQEEIAASLNISQAQVSRIEKRVLLKMKKRAACE